LRIVVVASQVGIRPSEVAYSFVFDEIVRIAKRGIDVHVARAKGQGYSVCYCNLCFHDMNKLNLRMLLSNIYTLKEYPFSTLLRMPFSIYLELVYSKHIARLIDKIKPDIIHAHFAYPEGWVSLLAKKLIKVKIPLVVTLHGYDILVEPKIGYGIRLNKKYDILVRKVLNEADAIIVASKAIYNETVKLLKNGKDKVYLVPNGVDLKKFNPSIDGSKIRRVYNAEDKYIIFTLRHHRPVYGLHYLVLAAREVLKQRRDVIFIIGGDGPLRSYYMELSKKLDIADHMHFPGMIPRDIVPYYYAASDIVVVPSLQEGWGLVATEAMACAKPVIATNVGGLPDQIIDGYNGFLIPPRNVKALAEKILYLLENPSEMRRMGLNGRRLAEEKFDIEKRIDKIINIYKTLIER
jgi:N-acetyl-alpha-D-glucosaminyl L-malate synthase BshA